MPWLIFICAWAVAALKKGTEVRAQPFWDYYEATPDSEVREACYACHEEKDTTGSE